jgi:voltage-gated potassium channel Kch
MRHLGFWASERSLSVLAGVIILSVFVIGPLTEPVGPGKVLLAVAYMAILVTGIATVSRTLVSRAVISIVALLSVVAWAVSLWDDSNAAQAGRTLSSAVFSLLLSGVVFHHIFRAGHVTVHRISGAVAAYVLIGLVFAFLYDAIERLAPGSFNFATAGARGNTLNDPMAYFSFATLTTVGYGDVTPQTPLTQSLSNIEALIGQLFPAILIARLVALEVSPRSDSKE